MATPATSLPDATIDKPRHPRRWIPLSLRIFVAMLLVVSVGGALWMGVRVYRQLAAIQEIRQVNGTVEFDPDAPLWLREWVSEDWLTAVDRISEVRLPFSNTLDDNTRHLLALRPLPDLYIEEGPPIHKLIRTGRLDEARSVLARHHILLFSRELGRTPLHIAVDEGDVDIQPRVEFVRFLIEQGAEIDALEPSGFTPLQRAGNPEIVKLLLDGGANLAVGGPNERALENAASILADQDADGQNNWLEIARLLRAAGADYDIVSACYLDDVVRVRQLVKRGMPARVHDALWAAAANGRSEIVQVLLEHGADPNDCNDGRPVAHVSIWHPELLEILFRWGGDPFTTYHNFDRVGDWTLLHAAAAAGVVESARLVLNRGVSVDARDAEGRTPLHAAAKAGQLAVAEFLLATGAQRDAKDRDGRTPLDLAREYGHRAITETEQRNLAALILLLSKCEEPDEH